MEAAAAAPQPAAAPLPFLGDDIFVLIAAELDARMLGRLGCVAQRFWRPSVPDPAHTVEDAGEPERWSVAEEGARRRLAAQSEQVRGWVSRETSGGWLRALGELEKLQRPLAFMECGPDVELSTKGERHPVPSLCGEMVCVTVAVACHPQPPRRIPRTANTRARCVALR